MSLNSLSPIVKTYDPPNPPQKRYFGPKNGQSLNSIPEEVLRSQFPRKRPQRCLLANPKLQQLTIPNRYAHVLVYIENTDTKFFYALQTPHPSGHFASDVYRSLRKHPFDVLTKRKSDSTFQKRLPAKYRPIYCGPFQRVNDP